MAGVTVGIAARVAATDWLIRKLGSGVTVFGAQDANRNRIKLRVGKRGGWFFILKLYMENQDGAFISAGFVYFCIDKNRGLFYISLIPTPLGGV